MAKRLDLDKLIRMPTVLTQNGFRFFIPTLDHPPAHVHVAKGGGQAKFNLLPVEVIKTKNMKMSEINEAFIIACQHQAELIQAWEGIHGRH